MSEAINKAQDCGIELQKGAPMIENQATADMLLMTHLFSAPAEKEEPVEVALVRAVLEGERDRFARLYEMYAPMVHGVLMARVPRDEVDDLVQDIFLHAPIFNCSWPSSSFLVVRIAPLQCSHCFTDVTN